MHDNGVKLTIEGLAKERGHVRLQDFLAELGHLRSALRRAEALLTGRPRASAYYRVVDLSHSSPAAVSIEGVGASAEVAISGLFEVEETIRKTGAAPEWADNDLLEEFLALTQPVGSRVGAVFLSGSGRRANFTEAFGATVSLLLVPNKRYLGSIVGRLERINLHAGANEFWLYPMAGPTKVKCRFSEALRKEAANSVDRRIRASGVLKRSTRAKWPSEMEVRRIKVLPRRSALPTLDSLRGIAPDATGDSSSENFIRELRDEWDRTG